MLLEVWRPRIWGPWVLVEVALSEELRFKDGVREWRKDVTRDDNSSS